MPDDHLYARLRRARLFRQYPLGSHCHSARRQNVLALLERQFHEVLARHALSDQPSRQPPCSLPSASAFRWHPHATPGAVLLKMHFIRGPQIYRLILHQHSEFFYFTTFCRSGSARDGKSALLFHTTKGTPTSLWQPRRPQAYAPTRLVQLGVEEGGMGWHSFKRCRKTWLRGRAVWKISTTPGWLHKPQTMSELYSHLHEELELRLA